MALKNALRLFFVDSEMYEKSDLIKAARKKMGEELYEHAVRFFTTYIQNKDRDIDGGYFRFAMIMGHSNKDLTAEADVIWQQMMSRYGTDDDANNIIHKILGTICMMCVARDPRPWLYLEDDEKHSKISRDEIPTPNQYFLGDYKLKKK